MDVPSVCTIVKTIEKVGPAYWQRQRQHPKRLVRNEEVCRIEYALVKRM
jgi:hypothetical protein